MEIKGSLLLVITFFRALNSEPVAQRSAEPQGNHNKHEEFNQLDDKDCVCFGKNPGSKTVADVLDPYNQGIERLVIYLYKPAMGDAMQMYIPNQNRQRIIPDLVNQDGDIFTRTPVDLTTIFTTNPSVVWPWHITTPSIDNNINLISNSITPVSQLLVKNIYDYNIFNERKQPISYKPNSWEKTVHQHPQPLHSDQGIIKPDKAQRVKTTAPVKLENSKPLKKYIFKDNMYGYAINNNPLRLIQSQNHISLESNSKDKDALGKIDNHFAYSGQIVQSYLNPSNPLPYKLIKYPIEASASASKYKFYSDDSIYNNDNTSSILTNKAAITFTKWILDEIRSLELDQVVKSHAIDAATLKNQIQIILAKYGITEASSGELIDSRGNVLNMANLRLRPIFVGDTTELNKITKYYNKELPFSKLLLMTLLHPSKVFGVIPIDNVRLPKKMNAVIVAKGENKASKFQRLEPIPSRNLGSIYEGIYNFNGRNDEVIPSNYFSHKLLSQIRKNKLKKRKKTFLPPIVSNGPVNLQYYYKDQGRHTFNAFKSDDDNLARKENDEVNRALNKSKYLKTFTNNPSYSSAQKVISINDFFDDYELESKSYKESLPRESNHGSKKLTGKQWKKIKNRYKYPNIASFYSENGLPFEDPDFRIIGGAAATFSGMPISNRGKRGYNIKLEK